MTHQPGLAVLLCLMATSASFGADKQTSYSVTYSGGSFQQVKTGEGFKMFLDQNQIRLQRHGDKNEPIVIDVKSITEVNYGNEAHRRVGTAMALAGPTLGLSTLIALSHSKKHYVGLVWDGGEGKKGGMVVQADKNEYRGIIAALEGITGKKAINSDTATSTVVVQ